jgi:hypothetical protein
MMDRTVLGPDRRRRRRHPELRRSGALVKGRRAFDANDFNSLAFIREQIIAGEVYIGGGEIVGVGPAGPAERVDAFQLPIDAAVRRDAP